MSVHELLEQFFGLTQEEQRELLKMMQNNVDESSRVGKEKNRGDSI